MVFSRPVAQAVQHHVAHDRVVTVQRVARAAEVEVVAFRRQHVVGLVVQPSKRDVWALFVALRRVIKDHVQDDFDAVAVQFFDQGLELVHLHAHLAGGGVAGFGSEEADGAVAPVIVSSMLDRSPGAYGCFRIRRTRRSASAQGS